VSQFVQWPVITNGRSPSWSASDPREIKLKVPGNASRLQSGAWNDAARFHEVWAKKHSDPM